MTWPTYEPLGDHGILVSYENRIDPPIGEKVRLLAETMEKNALPWLQEVVFSYRCILVLYDLHRIRYSEVLEFIKSNAVSTIPPDPLLPNLYQIPTVYGGQDGPDLKQVADITGYTPEEVIERFSATTFTIYFLGFLCAQPYLGGLPEDLHVPRQASPRLHMPAGSVGIGGAQASLITIDQPSGHNFIGRTSLSLYDPKTTPPTRLRAGDQIVFPSTSGDQIENFRGQLPVPLRRKGYCE
jgi:KipI family sensor histidine kinase inhibitor